MHRRRHRHVLTSTSLHRPAPPLPGATHGLLTHGPPLPPRTHGHPRPHTPTQAPTATSQEVKRAYYGLVRECHPDRSATEEAHELTSLLNEIYDVRIELRCAWCHGGAGDSGAGWGLGGRGGRRGDLGARPAAQGSQPGVARDTQLRCLLCWAAGSSPRRRCSGEVWDAALVPRSSQLRQVRQVAHTVASQVSRGSDCPSRNALCPPG